MEEGDHKVLISATSPIVFTYLVVAVDGSDQELCRTTRVGEHDFALPEESYRHRLFAVSFGLDIKGGSDLLLMLFWHRQLPQTR